MDLNLLQREVAGIIGVDKCTYENWEYERNEPGLRAWPAIIKFLGYDPRPPSQTIGQKLRLHREGQGLSWAEAARAMGVDPATVSKWENQPDERFDHRSLPTVIEFLGYNPLRPPQSPGERLRQIRYLAGLKQTEFAARLRVSNNAVSEWELDQKRPTLCELDRIKVLFPASPI